MLASLQRWEDPIQDWKNVWTSSRRRKGVERKLERCWHPLSMMDVWCFLTERGEHQTAVRLSQDIREEKKSLAEPSEDSSVRAVHVSSNSVFLSTGIQQQSQWKSPQSYTPLQSVWIIRLSETIMEWRRRCLERQNFPEWSLDSIDVYGLLL